MRKTIRFVLNGRDAAITTDDQRALLWVLRTELGLTGTKFGCGEAVCGSCTVVVNNQAVRSCVTPIGDVEGKKVVTIEGLANGDKLHAIQQAFVDHLAYQCGYCTPGMIMASKAFLDETQNPTEAGVRHALSGNLCRCTGYHKIVKAVLAVSKK